MTDQEAFLAHIAKQPWDDPVPRMIYADWLEERGEVEEAERQRKWVPAERWLRDFAGSHFNGYEAERSFSYEDIIQFGSDYIEHDDKFVQVGSDSLRDSMGGETLIAFWKNWEIVTGIKVTNEQRKEGPFCCTC